MGKEERQIEIEEECKKKVIAVCINTCTVYTYNYNIINLKKRDNQESLRVVVWHPLNWQSTYFPNYRAPPSANPAAAAGRAVCVYMRVTAHKV